MAEKIYFAGGEPLLAAEHYEILNALISCGNTDLEITYNMIGSDFFVISGINKENGNIVYWKRILAAEFVKDLHIEYNQSRKPDIEKYISRISKSFTSN